MTADRGVRAILFDLDGTLYDERGAMRAALAVTTAEATRTIPGFDAALACRLYEEIGRGIWEKADLSGSGPLPPPSSMELRQRVWGALLERLGVTEAGAAERLAARYARARSAGHVLFPEAAGVLERLLVLSRSGDSFKVGLVSNGASDLQREKLDHCGLSSLLEPILISSEVGWVKPEPEIFLEGVRQCGCLPEEALFVGDSLERDISGARAAGLRAVWVNRSGEDRLPGAWAAEFVLRDLTPLPEIVARDRGATGRS